MDFLDNIRSALAEYKMIEKGDAVVAALSGGADSVSLLHALTELSGELGITVYACHVNHHLRGAESDADMHFCEEFCKRLGVELRVQGALHVVRPGGPLGIDIEHYPAVVAVSGGNARHAF